MPVAPSGGEPMLDLALTADVSELADGINGIWILTMSFLVFFMQPGFVMLEAGQVRSKNVANVAMKNMFDWSLGVLAFFIVGLGVANAVGGLTSAGAVSLTESFSYVNTPGEWINWLFGAVFAMTAATIVSGAVAERIKFRSYVIYSVALTMLIYPVVVGLVWQGGLLSEAGYLGQLLGTGYLDFAGGTVVHMVGGFAGLTAAYVVGPRQDRYDDDGTSNPIPGHSVLFAVLGTLFLAFGWFGFNVGTQATVVTEDGSFLGAELGRVALTTTLAMGGGAVASSLVTTYYQGKPDPLFTANGLLAGLVAVTSAAAYVTWWGGLLLGALGGALVYPTFRWTVDTLNVDDVCGVFAVHGSAGGLGALVLPFVAVGSAGGWTVLGAGQIAMQVAGVALIGTWTVLTTATVFLVVDAFVGVRVGSDAEEPGLDRSEHNVMAYPQFVTDGGTDVDTGPEWGSQGAQEAESPTMWRGEEIETDDSTSVGAGAGIDQFPEPTLVVDPDNEIAALNARAARLFETVESEATGSTPGELVDRADGALDASARALREERELRDRTGSITVGGETVPISATATPLYEGEELTGAMLTVRTIADDVARERRRQTVEEYREAGLDAQDEKLAELAAGNLDLDPGVPAPPADREELTALADRFETMDERIVEIAGNVEDIVAKLPEQSEQLAEGSQSLSESSGEVQAAAVDIDDLTSRIEGDLADLSTHTSAASDNVAELSASVEQISASATQIESQSTRAADLTQEGVGEMTTAVSRIRTATDHSDAVLEEIETLERKMASVADIVTIIQDIAKQTNMLALNASIEAANADADGDGFAVVADEVKALAEQTKDSANDIEGIIDDVQSQTTTVTETIREANAEIGEGADAVETAVDLVEEIHDHVRETNDGVAEITDAVARQADNTEQVSASVQEVESMTDSIDDLAGRISTQADRQSDAIGDVAGLAERLNDIASEVHANIDRYDLASDLRAGAGGAAHIG